MLLIVIGRRKCLGEDLAKTSLFQFTTILFHHFKMEPGDDKLPTVLDGMTLGLTPFKVKLTLRLLLQSD